MKKTSTIQEAIEFTKLRNKFEKEFLGTIDEATFNRVASFLKNPKNDFVLITASRGNLSRTANKKNNNELISSFRNKFGNKKIGAYRLIGHWKECSIPLKDGEKISDCKGKITDSIEDSWLIARPDFISPEDFRKYSQEIAQRYNQDGYIIRIDGKTTLESKNGEVWDTFKNITNNPEDFVKLGFADLLSKQGYTQFKKDRDNGLVRSIVFEGIYVNIPKDNNSSRNIFEKMGTYFPN